MAALRTFIVLNLAILLAGASKIYGVSKTLYLSNPYDAGDWGSVSMCPPNMFVHAIEIKYENEEKYADNSDINGVKMYCSNKTQHDGSYVTSTVGRHGDWYGMKVCKIGFITGFRGQVLDHTFDLIHDDVAVQDMHVECNHGTETIKSIDTQLKLHEGKWSAWARCPVGTAVCGLQTRVKTNDKLSDKLGVTDLNLFCCS